MFIIIGKTLAFPEMTLCPKAVCVLLDLALQFLTEQNHRMSELQGVLEITRLLVCSRTAGGPERVSNLPRLTG